MRLLIITITLVQCLPVEWGVFGLPQGSSIDPCEASPCGKGAECKAMGSIAICVCPNDNGKGDPFVNCMQQGFDENTNFRLNNPDGGSSSSPSLDTSQFVASFEVGSVHHPNAKPTQISTTTTTTNRPRISSTLPTNISRTTAQPSKVTGSPTTKMTTTKNPFVHVFETSTYRPPNVNVGHDHSYPGKQQGDSYDLYEHNRNRNRDRPESHRIPIIENKNNIHYPHHEYPPRPISGSEASTTSSIHPINHVISGITYDIFNERNVGPIADYGGRGGVTSSYPYRGSSSTGHFGGNHFTHHEYNGRPVAPTSAYHTDRFGHHSYHPSSSGFPSPITESSNTHHLRDHSSSSSYDVYNFNSVNRNDIINNDYGGYTRVSDPLGKYQNCRLVSGIVVCADNANRYPPHYRDHGYSHHGSSPAYNFPLRGEEITTTTNYGFHADRNRDHYSSSYYPDRYPSTSSVRPMFNYDYISRQGYPDHGPRRPIESDRPFLPKEQHISTQSVLAISSSTTPKNDNDHPMCKSMCGYNSICRLHLDRPVCGCDTGHTGDPSVRCTPVSDEVGGDRGARKDGECEHHVDCKSSEICAKAKCIDPCKDPEGFSSSSVIIDGSGGNSICGTNASCIVIMRTPVCQCKSGFSGNPYVACVP